ncbi:hypothetical protein ACWCXX_24395 [Streptomyces sp. NPDC001732]
MLTRAGRGTAAVRRGAARFRRPRPWRIALGAVLVIVVPVLAAGTALRLGYTGDPGDGTRTRGRERFGVALYVDFAARDGDWAAYREDWN